MYSNCIKGQPESMHLSIGLKNPPRIKVTRMSVSHKLRRL